MLTSALAKQVPLVLAGTVALSFPFSSAVQAFTLVDQIGDGSEGFASQIFEPSYAGFNVAYLDDFTVTTPVSLRIVEAIFFGSPTFNPADYGSIEEWRVEIYSSPETAAASKNLEGDAGRQRVTPDPKFVSSFNGSSNKNLVSIPVNINLFKPGDYWISVIPVLSYLPNSSQPSNTKQLFVLSTSAPESVGGFNSVQVNPGGLFRFENNIRLVNANAAYRVKGEVIPTPALLPGLIGFSIGMWRRRKQNSLPD